MKYLVLAALLWSSVASATKARLTALGNSFHLRGTQTGFTTPTHILGLENFVTYEAGLTTPAAATITSGNTLAEGAVLMNAGEGAKLLFALGHIDEAIQIQRGFINVVGGYAFKPQQNPFQVLYAWKSGDNSFGVGAFYSNYNNKTTGAEEKESSTGLRVSGSHGAISWRANLGLTNTAQTTAAKFTGKPYMNLAGRYTDGNLRYALDYTTWGVKVEDTAPTTVQDHDFQNVLLRFVNAQKTETADWYYGLGLSQTTLKDKLASDKFTRMTLPVLMAVETKANDWLTLRGSVSQTVFVAQSKDERGYPLVGGVTNPASGTPDQEFAAEANNTAVAVGAGLKFGKVTIDGTLRDLVGANAGQKINGTNLLAQVGLVYNY